MAASGLEVNSKERLLPDEASSAEVNKPADTRPYDKSIFLLFLDTVCETCSGAEDGLSLDVLHWLLAKFFTAQGLGVPSPQQQGKAIAAWFAKQIAGEKEARKRRKGRDGTATEAGDPQLEQDVSTDTGKERKGKKLVAIGDKKIVQVDRRDFYTGIRVKVQFKKGSVFSLPWDSVNAVGCPQHVRNLFAHFPSEFKVSMLTFDKDELLARPAPIRMARNLGVRLEQPGRSQSVSHAEFRVPREPERRHMSTQVGGATLSGQRLVYTQMKDNCFVVFLGILPVVTMEDILLRVGEGNSLVFSGPVGKLVSSADNAQEFPETWESVGETCRELISGK